ncbi:hypothetical protein WA158_001026 [Blastocystis sp. Blastoise]
MTQENIVNNVVLSSSSTHGSSDFDPNELISKLEHVDESLNLPNLSEAIRERSHSFPFHKDEDFDQPLSSTSVSPIPPYSPSADYDSSWNDHPDSKLSGLSAPPPNDGDNMPTPNPDDFKDLFTTFTPDGTMIVPQIPSFLLHKNHKDNCYDNLEIIQESDERSRTNSLINSAITNSNSPNNNTISDSDEATVSDNENKPICISQGDVQNTPNESSLQNSSLQQLSALSGSSILVENQFINQSTTTVHPSLSEHAISSTISSSTEDPLSFPFFLSPSNYCSIL